MGRSSFQAVLKHRPHACKLIFNCAQGCSWRFRENRPAKSPSYKPWFWRWRILVVQGHFLSRTRYPDTAGMGVELYPRWPRLVGVLAVTWHVCFFFLAVLARVTMTSYANVREGKDLNLTCHVTGTPPPSVEWTKVGEPAAVLSNTSVLTLRSVTRPGNANQTVQYRCTASNGYGEPDSAEVTVQLFCE